ncbi:MAG: hypothetical protein NTY81_01010 [Candidatus Staskawiczbacteria bacterium]|nr:hypothetical protein [Candidatus Staskawiczbacteria bacterium]
MRLALVQTQGKFYVSIVTGEGGLSPELELGAVMPDEKIVGFVEVELDEELEKTYKAIRALDEVIACPEVSIFRLIDEAVTAAFKAGQEHHS